MPPPLLAAADLALCLTPTATISICVPEMPRTPANHMRMKARCSVATARPDPAHNVQVPLEAQQHRSND